MRFVRAVAGFYVEAIPDGLVPVVRIDHLGDKNRYLTSDISPKLAVKLAKALLDAIFDIIDHETKIAEKGRDEQTLKELEVVSGKLGKAIDAIDELEFELEVGDGARCL